LGRKGRGGRSYADAPEIDGTVKPAAAGEASKTLKVGRVHQGAHRRHAKGTI